MGRLGEIRVVAFLERETGVGMGKGKVLTRGPVVSVIQRGEGKATGLQPSCWAQPKKTRVQGGEGVLARLGHRLDGEETERAGPKGRRGAACGGNEAKQLAQQARSQREVGGKEEWLGKELGQLGPKAEKEGRRRNFPFSFSTKSILKWILNSF
jgi:hypothetical protein